VASYCGLTVSLAKTNGLAIGTAVSEDNIFLVVVSGGEIGFYLFMYVGFKLSCDGEITCCHVAEASEAFGFLRAPIFLNQTLLVDTKRAVYKAIIIPIL